MCSDIFGVKIFFAIKKAKIKNTNESDAAVKISYRRKTQMDTNN
jgi:hypothetical protein